MTCMCVCVCSWLCDVCVRIICHRTAALAPFYEHFTPEALIKVKLKRAEQMEYWRNDILKWQATLTVAQQCHSMSEAAGKSKQSMGPSTHRA